MKLKLPRSRQILVGSSDVGIEVGIETRTEMPRWGLEGRSFHTGQDGSANQERLLLVARALRYRGLWDP